MKNRKNEKAKEMRFCPNCGNDEIILVAGGNLGMYECKNCGFRGAIFPEATKKEIEKIRGEINKDRKNK